MLWKIGKRKDAQEYFDQSAKGAPNMPERIIRLYNEALKKKDFKAAGSLAKSYLENSPFAQNAGEMFLFLQQNQ